MVCEDQKVMHCGSCSESKNKTPQQFMFVLQLSLQDFDVNIQYEESIKRRASLYSLYSVVCRKGKDSQIDNGIARLRALPVVQKNNKPQCPHYPEKINQHIKMC